MTRALSLSAVLALTVAAPAMAENWDMPVAYPASNYLTELAVDFGKCVDEKTAGAIQVTVHPGGSLFNGADIKRAVQTGQAPIGERLLSAHENENPLFGIDALPFVATSFDASEKLWAAARPELEKVLGEQNLVYLYAAPWPPQGLYTKKEVGSAADLKGVKFRAYNAATAKLAELAGMVPVQIEAAELAQALATGVAESFISSGTTGVDSKVWESLTHFYDVQAWIPHNTVFANKDAFGALPEDQQAAIRTCADEAAANGLARAKELTQQMIDTLAENGMTVSPPSDQLRADLEGFGAVMVEDWLAKAGDQGKTVLDAYKAE